MKRIVFLVAALIVGLVGFNYLKDFFHQEPPPQGTASITYERKDSAQLFEYRGEKLKTVERMIYVNDYLKSAVFLKEKGTATIYYFQTVSYTAFDHYTKTILHDFMKENPDFEFSIRDQVSGIGKLFGVNDDPFILMAKNGAAELGAAIKSMLFFVVIIILIVLVNYKFMQHGNANRVGMYKPSELTDDLDDLVGMNDIKQELLQLEEMIRSRSLYRQYGADKTFNVMLTGAAGVGKTKIARCLAKRLGYPLFYTSAASLETGYVGGGPRTLKRLYERALKEKRAIIFLDEAEGLFRNREQSTASRHENEAANTLLSLLDGVNTEKSSEIIWVVASNFDESRMKMDSAMLRRFQLKINFRMPNQEERKEILNRLLKKCDESVIGSDINLEHIASITTGMSPAILETLVHRASLMAVRERAKITQDVMLKAFERISVGLTDRATTANMEKKRRIIAIHEAGHFLMQVHNAMVKARGDISRLKENLNVIKISTESVSKLGALGFVLSKTDDAPLMTRTEYEMMVCELYGGLANEEIFNGHSAVTSGAHNDIEKITEILNMMVNEVGFYQDSKVNYRLLGSKGLEIRDANLQRVESKASELYNETKRTLSKMKPLSEKLVELLINNYVLTIEEALPHVEKYLREHSPSVMDTKPVHS